MVKKRKSKQTKGHTAILVQAQWQTENWNAENADGMSESDPDRTHKGSSQIATCWVSIDSSRKTETLSTTMWIRYRYQIRETICDKIFTNTIMSSCYVHGGRPDLKLRGSMAEVCAFISSGWTLSDSHEQNMQHVFFLTLQSFFDHSNGSMGCRNAYSMEMTTCPLESTSTITLGSISVSPGWMT